MYHYSDLLFIDIKGVTVLRISAPTQRPICGALAGSTENTSERRYGGAPPKRSLAVCSLHSASFQILSLLLVENKLSKQIGLLWCRRGKIWNHLLLLRMGFSYGPISQNYAATTPLIHQKPLICEAKYFSCKNLFNSIIPFSTILTHCLFNQPNVISRYSSCAVWC